VVKYVARTPVSANSSSSRGAPCSIPRKVVLRYGGQSGSKSTVSATRSGAGGRVEDDGGTSGWIGMEAVGS
jgi:hypothetical protein